MKHVKKTLLLVIGMTLVGLGTYFNTKTGLGNSATGSVPYLLHSITNIKLGTATYLVYFVLILIQSILNKKFELKSLLQIFLVYLFGELINLISNLIPLNITNIWMSFVFLFISINLIGLGMVLMLKSKLIVMPPDGVVKAIRDRFKVSFGMSKNIFDLIMALISIITGLIVKHQIIGVGIGTIIAVFMIGRTVSIYEKLLKKITI